MPRVLAACPAGMLVGAGPARSFEDSEAFVKDVCDGYFPQEFKSQYPDGIKLDVRDCRSERAPFQGPGQASGRKARTLSDIGATDMRVDDFLNKLPQKTIVDGRPVDVPTGRGGGIRARQGIKAVQRVGLQNA